MCGRYVLYSDKEEMAIKAIVAEVNKKYQMTMKKGDIYPSDLAPVYTGQAADPGIELKLMRWGYQRDFGKKTLLINARSETVLEKASFREDFLNRRCLIPAVGFYEWNQKKEKFRFVGVDDLIYLGGFYHLPAKGSETFVIMTKSPVELVAAVHDRMPVIIPQNQASDFLYSTETALKLISENRVELKREAIVGTKQDSFIDLLEDPHQEK